MRRKMPALFWAGKSEGNLQLGRPVYMLKYNIKMHLKVDRWAWTRVI